jgi:hypothetical protein
MTLKIETHSDGNKLTIRLSGRMREECIQALKALLDDATPETVLNLGDVSLVGVEVVRFLAHCEKAGVELLDCSPYIRDWIDREHAKNESERLENEQ